MSGVTGWETSFKRNHRGYWEDTELSAHNNHVRVDTEAVVNGESVTPSRGANVVCLQLR